MRRKINGMKGWISVAIGVIACPCHLPITLPIALSLTAGTVAGAWITNNTLLIGGVFTVLFLGGLGLGFHWLSKEEALPIQSQNRSIEVLVLTSSTCTSCKETVKLWQQLKTEHKFGLKVLDVNSRNGRQLAGEKNIFSTPVTLVNDKIAFRGVPKLEHATAVVKR
ncbi:MAG: thioredoxin family protein [Chloroflexi bacterium]|nr:thioredoxin family protein [Chloroflexota bacterium]